MPLTKQQKESSNNFKKHFCSACRLQSLPGCLHLPALEFPLQGKLFPAGTEGGTWAGGNGVAKHKPTCAGEGLCGCVGMGGSVQPSCCTTHPAPRTGTRLRAGDSLCPAEWKIILATAPHSAGPHRVRGREGFVCFGVSTAPVVMWGLRSPGCGWGWGTSMNCHSWRRIPLAVPGKRDSVIVMGIKMDKIIKMNVWEHLGLYTPSKCTDDKTALWVQG